jgi:uncharacterized protein YdhG (YjbR/CyaY superfamily)
MLISFIQPKISAPVIRALDGKNIKYIEDFKNFTRQEIAELHGIGKNALEIIEKEMFQNGISFKEEIDNPNVDEYIQQFVGGIRKKLEQIRLLIRKTIPYAQEKMAYGIPTYYYKENVVHFAGFKQHIGFYPTPDGTELFKVEISKYKSSKGAIQFDLDKPLPEELIKRIVEFRYKEINSIK